LRKTVISPGTGDRVDAAGKVIAEPLRFSTRELALGFVAVLGSLPSSPDETFRLTDDADDSSPASRHKKKAFSVQ
jgi:hypothetical protein